MNRRALVRQITDLGAVFVREGAKHTVYMNPRTRRLVSVPRHQEIKKHTAEDIIKDAAE